ncbi:LPXTG cell wall anchor domain-containing protein [Lentzea sp. NBRC 102530]|uniref:LPXTG cell wall anchor domain-containing protein n=1 Tax=Lentzea sp. NBRC 102530 TaxID=3032201 RepID=UPI00255331B4|nr:LPXTG cell wall anchor domain-containing protein [Lentzea sp. NBRC 102530]
MKKFFAAAQDETITVEDLFCIDRDGDNAFTAGENVRANGPGVQIRVQGAGELVGTYPTGPDGRYKAVLPEGPQYVTSNLETDYSSTKIGHDASESRTGLASTGASVFGFLGLGALLLAGGAAAFFVARRRRA